jgi:MarR-like DNA-binding transcriptional regulator SgrR of sgrS sRNA
MRIKGDIIASHFRPETIAKQSLIQYTDDARYAEPAIELLKNSWSYQYRLEIEVDSMSIPDYNAERQARVEYVTAVGQYMSQVWPMVEANPAVAPFFLRMLQWVSMGFRASSGIESVLDTAIKNVEVFLQQKAQEPPKPSPEEMKAKAEIEAIGAKTEADIKSQQMKTQSDVRSKQMKTQSDVAAQQMKTTADITTQQSKVQADMKASVAKALADIMIAQKKAEAAEELAENKED